MEAERPMKPLAKKKRQKKDKGKDASAKGNTSSTKEDKAPGHCDVCQMPDRFKKMTLLKCKDCGVKVHDRCYGSDESKYDHRDDNFSCWACQAKGTKVKVREIDPFTQQRRIVSTPKTARPTHCCLCSIDDGIHAMHPVYDSHGTRGRQIWLPPDEATGARRLAWCHTLCALTINSVGPTKGSFYACSSRGFYDPDDMQYVSETESVNSDLEDEAVVSNLHHYVYWGHYDRSRGRPVDAHGKTFEQAKGGNLKCIYCGKDDGKTMELAGQTVYRSLRVPLQCTANNRTEFYEFRKLHKGQEHCYQALHAGCAMWGRNQDKEQSLVRRSYFYPGLQHMLEDKDKKPVVEVYCDCHAKDLFMQPGIGVSSSNNGKLSGPFAEVSGAAKRRLIKHQQAKDGTSDQTAKAGKVLKNMKASGVPTRIIPGASKKRKSATEAATTGAKAAPAITLHGETRIKKKRERAMLTAGDAVVVQTGKHGRLVSKQKPSNVANTAADVGDNEPKLLAQRILENLAEEKKRCVADGKTFHTATVTAPLRIRWFKKSTQEGIKKNVFDDSWKKALASVKKGVVELEETTTKEAANASKLKDSERRNSDAAEDDNVSDNHPEDTPAATKQPWVASDNIFQSSEEESSQEVDHGGMDTSESVAGNKSSSFKGRLSAAASADKDANRKKQASILTAGSVANKSNSESTSQPQDERYQQHPQHYKGLLDALVDELVEQVDPLGNEGDSSDEEDLAHRSSKVLQLFKEAKMAWKKKSGLSKADFKLFFADVTQEVQVKCPWLEISGRHDDAEKSASTANASGSAAASADPTSQGESNVCLLGRAKRKTKTTRAIPAKTKKSRKNHLPSGGEDMMITDLIDLKFTDSSCCRPDRNESDLKNSTKLMPSPPKVLQGYAIESDKKEPPPHQFSHLSYGMYFDHVGFNFDAWDEKKVINP